MTRTSFATAASGVVDLDGDTMSRLIVSGALTPRASCQRLQTEMPKSLFDGFAFLGRARYYATTPAGAIRRTARR
jgi:hypothetical protein